LDYGNMAGKLILKDAVKASRPPYTDQAVCIGHPGKYANFVVSFE